METLIQQATRRNQERYQDEQGKLGPFAGKVVSVRPYNDELGMSFGPAAERRMPVQHPFSGSTSWIRSMPEIGTVFLLQNRFDSGQAEAIKTIPVSSALKAEAYINGLNTYRSLSPGEHDISSVGSAFAYFGRRGNLDLRSGGTVKLQLNRERQDITSQAPTHRQNLLYWTAGEMGDEIRTGVIKRWNDAYEEVYVKKDSNFLAEHYLHLKNPSKQGPVALLRRIEGHVYDDKKLEIKHKTTALPLRSQALWYTTTDEFTRREIDQNGNMLIEFPSTASTGYEVLIPAGSYRKVIEKDRDVTINKDEKVIVQKNINYTVGQNVTYNVTKSVTINAGGNLLKLDATADKESASLLNKKQLGLVATPDTVTLSGPSSTSLSIASSGATTLTAKSNLTLTVDADMIMEGKSLNANFDKINLGKGASIPAVLGIALQSYLDQHMHTTTAPGAPTSPPNLPSASFNGTPQSITSIKVQLMGNI